jgi:hypothetical protein
MYHTSLSDCLDADGVSNRSAGYSNGVMLLAKVVLGKVYNVGAFAQVRACPAGYDSVSDSVTVVVTLTDRDGVFRSFLTEITAV